MAHHWSEYDEAPCITQESDSHITMELFSEKVERSQRCLPGAIELIEQIPSAVHYKQHPDNLPMLDDYLKYSYHFFFHFCVKYSICHEDNRVYSIEGDYQTKCSHWSCVLLKMFKEIKTSIYLFPSLRKPCAHDCLYKLLGKKFT